MRELVVSLLDTVPRGRLRFVISTILDAASSASSIALMGVAAWLLSRAAEHPPVLYLSAAAVGVRFFGIARGVTRYTERLIGHDLALRMQGALRLRTYDHLSRTTLLGGRRGDRLTKVTADVEAIQDLVVRVAIPFCSASVVILGTTIMLGRFSPASALVLLGTGVLAGLVLPWITQRLSRSVDAASVPLRGELASAVHELARTSVDLVAYDQTSEATDRVLAVDAALRHAEQRAAWVRGLAIAGQVIASGIAVATALVIGAQAVAADEMAPRLLAVLVLTPLAMHEVLANFTAAAQTLTRAKAALGRVVALLAETPVGRGDADPEAPAVPGVEFISVDAGWPGAEPVVRDFTLRVGPGEKVALVGASGIGKTTLAATAMGLIPPMAGSVTSGRVGYLAQDAHIFATTIAENVRIGNRDATDADVASALERAGLSINPDRVVGEYGATLSGGEARRVALARVLAGQHHDLLILDEPTEHLDAETATALMADLWSAAASLPILVITHDADVMAACDRVVTLDAVSQAPTPGGPRGHDPGTRGCGGGRGEVVLPPGLG